MHTSETSLPGVLELSHPLHRDDRGSFLKSYSREQYVRLGLNAEWAETYSSWSQESVVRGLHFQMPPHDHHKLVTCLSGEVQDVAVDLRVGSPTYGEHCLIHLSADRGNSVYLPRGLAHGFFVTSEKALLLYQVETAYSAEHDAGVRWDSAGIAWASKDVLVSKRDQLLPGLEEFRSPFRYREGE